MYYYIYKFTNKINGKIYIGQTNNIEKRKRGHKSESFNPKAKGYSLPFHNAIRKYGWNNFDFEILEEISEDFGYEYADEREKYFITKYNSLKENGHGYNITIGGQGCPRLPLSFEEQVKLSKIFNIEQVKDIQQMLIDNYQYYEILNKYPQLTSSFLSNINCGYNFYREDCNYPLALYHTKFSKETQDRIISDIKNNLYYKDIAKKYGISEGLISSINNGKKWHRNDLSYPLAYKACADGVWSHEAKRLLIFTQMSHESIGKKFGKQKATITALNVGRNRKDNRFLYPLRQNQIKNQEIWNTLF